MIPNAGSKLDGPNPATAPARPTQADRLRQSCADGIAWLNRQMDELPIIEFGSSGPLREKLVAAIVAGEKTATSSLVAAYASAGESLPQVGQRGTVIDSEGTRRALTETTAVEVSPLSEVPLAHALAEGEGYADVAAWRGCAHHVLELA